MLVNTRGRTVFNDTPKRLPADIDKASLYKGTMVRKRSLNRLVLGGALADDSSSTRDSTPKNSPPKTPASEASPAGDMSARPGRPPLGLRRSASTPMVSPCGSARGPGGRPPPPPPLPSFPSNWKVSPSDALKPVSARSQCAGTLEDSKSHHSEAACTAADKIQGPALRPRPKPLRVRAPDVLENSLSNSDEHPLSPDAVPGQTLPHSTLGGECTQAITTSDPSATSGVNTPSTLQQSQSTPHQPPAPPDNPLRRCPGPGFGCSSSAYPADVISGNGSTTGRGLPLAPPALISQPAAMAIHPEVTQLQQASSTTTPPQLTGESFSPLPVKKRPETVVSSLAVDADTSVEHADGHCEHPASPAAAAGQALLYAALSPTARGVHRTCFPWLSAGEAMNSAQPIF